MVWAQASDYVRLNWVFEPWPASDQWLVILTGLLTVEDFHSSGPDWTTETLVLPGDQLIGQAIAQRNIPTSVPGNPLGFRVAEWAPYVALTGVTNDGQAINAGWQVTDYRLTLMERLSYDGSPLPDLLDSIEIDLAVRDSDGYIASVGFHVTLFGGVAEYRAGL